MSTFLPSITTTGGAVTVSDLARRSSAILDAVVAGAMIPISRRGTIVAVIEPATARTVVQAGLELDDPKREVTARELARGNPSAVIDRAAKGEELYLTRQGRAVGLVRPVERWSALEELMEFDLGEPVPEDSRPGT